MPVRLLAAGLLLLEAVGVVILLAWQAMAIVAGDIVSVPSALALAVLTLVGAAALGAFAVGAARDRSWGRSGGIVAQALILAVALGALTGDEGNPLLAAMIAAPAIVCGILLFLAVRDAGKRASGREAS